MEPSPLTSDSAERKQNQQNQMKRLRNTIFNGDRVMKFLNEILFDVPESDTRRTHQQHRGMRRDLDQLN